MRTFDSREFLGRGTHWTALIGAVAIMVVAVAICADVLLRWLFNAPILGVDDLGQFNLAVIVSCFFPMCLVGGHNITVRFLGRWLGTRIAMARGFRACLHPSDLPSVRLAVLPLHPL